jgi:hypothetical protein
LELLSENFNEGGIKMIFDRSDDEHFTREIFKIRNRFRMQAIPMYRLKDIMNEPNKKIFYEPANA